MRNKLLLFLLSLCLVLISQAQEDSTATKKKKRGQYSLDIYVGGGIAYYFSVAGVPEYLQPEISKWSSFSSIRVMWHPDHRIKVGVETGKMRFLSYAFKDSIGESGKIIVDAVPLLVEWSMGVTRRLNVFAGSGVYFLKTKMDYSGPARSDKLSIGWMAAVSFIQPLNKDLSIGAELKWMDAAETTDGSLALQVQLIWKFLKW
jgi:hypothetical protein